MAEPVLRLENLTRDFDGLRAVDGLNLTVPPGEIYGFLGPNGAGKTTTLRMIAGLLNPTSGTIRISGIDPAENPVTARSKITYLPDTPYVYPHLTLEEYLHVWLELHQKNPERFESKMNSLLERFRIDDKRHLLTENLSHGMRQKMLITGLLLLEPKLFLIDEPLVGLDPYSLRQFKQLMSREVSDREASVVLSSHSLSAVESFAGRVGILSEGELLAEGPLNELRQDPDEALEEVFLRLTESG